MRTFFVGDVISALPILQAIADQGRLVGAAVDGERHRQTARELGIDPIASGSLNGAAALRGLRDLDIDLIVNFNSTVVFREDLLDCPRIGSINFHPGLLPGYAGLNVHQWAILNGEAETGSTIHVMTPRIDAGGVLAQSTLAIGAADTGLLLFMKLLRDGASLMASVLQDIAKAGFAEATPQKQDFHHYYRRSDRPCGRIDFSKSTSEVDRLIRALSYRPMESPLGVAYLETPLGRMEPAMISSIPSPPGATRRPGEVVSIEADLLEIACADGILAVKSAYVGGERLKAGIAAGNLGLRVGSMV